MNQHMIIGLALGFIAGYYIAGHYIHSGKPA